MAEPGDTAVLDSLNFHKMVAVRRAIEAAGIPDLVADLQFRVALRRLRAALPLRRIVGWFRGALAEAQLK